MSFSVTKVDNWTSKIEDKPGGLARVLGALGITNPRRAVEAAGRQGVPVQELALLDAALVALQGRHLPARRHRPHRQRIIAGDE